MRNYSVLERILSGSKADDQHQPDSFLLWLLLMMVVVVEF